MNDGASALLVVVLNGSPIIEFDRNKPLSDAQKESLKLMDEKLDQGITLDDQFYSKPVLEQRVEFVAANLFSALLTDEEVLAAASCAYLAMSLPDLKQIKGREENGQISIELIFDREYLKEVKLKFLPLDKITTQH